MYLFIGRKEEKKTNVVAYWSRQYEYDNSYLEILVRKIVKLLDRFDIYEMAVVITTS